MLRIRDPGFNAFLTLGSENRDPGWTNMGLCSTRIRNPVIHIRVYVQYVTQNMLIFRSPLLQVYKNVSLKTGWRWVAKWVSLLLATAAPWVRIQSSLKNTN